jgi:hypothetical protein
VRIPTRHRRFTAQILSHIAAGTLVVSLAACAPLQPTAVSSGDGKAVQAASSPAPSPALTGILDASVRSTTFDQVKQAIDNLYRDHPGVNSFVAQGVTYTPETRDKVLKICHEGGLVANEAERDAQEVLACAPLIYFFYRYGQESGVPGSVDVARQLYWYTVSNHPDESSRVLIELLRGWGIN